MTSDASLSSRMLHRRHGIFQIRGLPTLEPLRSVQHTAPPAGKQMSVPLSNQAYDIYIYAFSRHFYPKRLTIAFRLYIFINMCVPWESNPQLFALLTQCSTTEPHRNTFIQFRDIFAQLTLGLHCCASVSLAPICSSAQEMFRGEVS